MCGWGGRVVARMMSERPSTASLGSGLAKQKPTTHRKPRPHTAHSSMKKGRKTRVGSKNAHIAHASTEVGADLDRDRAALQL